MNILTAQQAAELLRYDSPDEMPGFVSSIILPAIDGFMKEGTGKAWEEDNPIDPVAKLAASMLLVQWYENPAMIGKSDNMHFGLINLMTQLQAKALQDESGD